LKLADIIVVAAACLIASGCAVNVQQQRAQRLDEMLANAEKYASGGHEKETGDAIHELLQERPAGLKELFARSVITRRVYLEYLRHQVALGEGSTPRSANLARGDLQWAGAADVLTVTELDSLQHHLDSSVDRANRGGTVPFDLTNGTNFAVLKTPENRALLVERSIAAVQAGNIRQDQLQALVDFVKTTNLSPGELDHIEDALDRAGLRRPDLQGLEPVFPQLVTKWRQKLFVHAEFKMKGGDRLLEEDLRKALSDKAKGLDLVGNGASAPLRITVEKVRQDEHTAPESHETVTYAQYQVDIGYAVLLMPRNASYIYDISRSGASIDYGYVVTVEEPSAQRFEKLVRGTATGEQIHCSNARVQNVFGGVQGADWVANSDMAARCHGGNGKSVNELREEILREVVNAATQAPQLKPLVDAE
jgi:hypothetical protein